MSQTKISPQLHQALKEGLDHLMPQLFSDEIDAEEMRPDVKLAEIVEAARRKAEAPIKMRLAGMLEQYLDARLAADESQQQEQKEGILALSMRMESMAVRRDRAVDETREVLQKMTQVNAALEIATKGNSKAHVAELETQKRIHEERLEKCEGRLANPERVSFMALDVARLALALVEADRPYEREQIEMMAHFHREERERQSQSPRETLM